MEKQKRVAAVHDISCFGKCSLTVALPVISATGIEVSAIPTAVLSTHTGGFTGFTYRDLTDDIAPIAKHWKSLDIKFDALYTGFLGSFKQIDIVSNFFDMFQNENTLTVVDPVMGDNGSLYSVFPENFPDGMKKLCSKADLIVPNLTEALLMLHEPYVEGPYTKEFIEDVMHKLSKFGPKQIVLTGVYFDDKQLGAACYDAETNEINYALSERVEGYYHGTGDVFASALVSAVLNGCTLKDAVKISVDFTVGSIKRTKEAATDIRFGVNFEAGLEKLAHEVKKNK